MARPGPRKRITGTGIDHDIITRLPGDTKVKILTKLPLKDAVRTCILSTKWRYTWASMPELVVKDDDLTPTINASPLLGTSGAALVASIRFLQNVDALLLTHNGPILKFFLSTKCHCPSFDRWILNLSRNGITELTFLLTVSCISKYRISSNFFCCDALQHVDLSRCLIELPPGFEGLKNLRTLQLEMCTISAADLEWLVSSSPNLVKLILEGFQIKDNLRIISKGLTFLNVMGDFSDVQTDAPNLIALFLGFSNHKNSPPRVRCLNKICQSLGGLLSIELVRVLGSSVQNFVDRSPAELLNSCLTKLSSVYMSVDLADHKESDFTFSLLQKATNLQDLSLFVKGSENTNMPSLWDKNIVLKSLQIVLVHKFIASKSVLAFVKFILSSASNLRKLTLMEEPTDPKEGNPEILKQLLKFERASTRAQVIFE